MYMYVLKNLHYMNNIIDFMYPCYSNEVRIIFAIIVAAFTEISYIPNTELLTIDGQCSNVYNYVYNCKEIFPFVISSEFYFSIYYYLVRICTLMTFQYDAMSTFSQLTFSMCTMTTLYR